MESRKKTRVIGIDAGTNSLGWAIVDRDENYQYTLIDRGVNIFQEGVKIEKGIESSRAAERTEQRSTRKHYWRRKIRKIELLRDLSKANLCPNISDEELKAWRKGNIYPKNNEEFMQWQGTDDKNNYQPYALRHIAVTTPLDMTKIENRWLVGRALYHIAQRRGFLSNRKEQNKTESGKVKEGIGDLNAQMESADCEYLCNYFYKLYQKGERIRAHYTDRIEHYEKEFNRICELQQIEPDLATKLHHDIFYQRPLKSQKQSVGKCPMEPTKTRCALSHPLYEDFRMWSFIRNIKIQTPNDCELRPLSTEEIEKILSLFYRKSERSFYFEDIAKKLAPKKQYSYYKDADKKPFLFNYHMDTSVSMSVVNANLRHVFGENWVQNAYNSCTTRNKKDGSTKIPKEVVDDIWQALSFYDNEDKLKEYAKTHFNLDEKHAESFASINLPQGYANLSLKAISLIMPLMRDHGLQYSHACFIAKLQEFMPEDWDKNVENKLIPLVNDVLLRAKDDFGIEYKRKEREERFKETLIGLYGLKEKQLNKLYHPSMIEAYPKAKKASNKALYQLGSPRVSAVKNPMAMHSLFRMRKVLNELLQEELIDENTIVHIEFARELNDANKRKAISKYQKNLEEQRQEAIKNIQKGTTISEPTETDIQKYLLWEEQERVCVYTGRTIGLADLFNGKTFDIEHTIPRSMGGDSTRANLTICDSKFNREVKRDKLPSQLSCHYLILERIAKWKEKADNFAGSARKINTRGVSTKEQKDSLIAKRNLLLMQADYWRSKYESFCVDEKDVEGFSRRQGTDISVINRYAKMYLQSVFEKVDVVKGTMTAAFRKEWGLQSMDEKKIRANNAHHCIDAVTIACMGKADYDMLSRFYKMDEMSRRGEVEKPRLRKPWPTFTEDMNALREKLVIAHYTADNMPKHTRKKLRNRNGIIRGKDGKALVAQGDTARGPLHLDTMYGAIKHDEQIKYVQRVMLDTLKEEKDILKIVDEVVKEKIQTAFKKYGSIEKALEAGPIWMNEQKHIPIRHVRVFAPTVTRPNHIRQQRDLSKHEHKQQCHVMSDSNYLMAIYEGTDAKGKIKREFKLISNLAAANAFKQSQHSNNIVPAKSDKGYPLKMVLKKGTMVLLYENTPDEIWNSDKKEKTKRLYKVTGMSTFLSKSCEYGRITFIHNQEARPASELKKENRAYLSGEKLRAKILLYHTQIKALIEGQDFNITETGRIERLC